MVQQYDGVAVVGGGPAGLMVATVLAEQGTAVTVFEARPNFGRKFLLAGRSGLNLTHAEPLETFAERYVSAPSHKSAEWLERFSPEDLQNFVGSLGFETFVGSSGRVFPKIWRGTEILRAWLIKLDRLGVQFKPRHELTTLGADGLQFETPSGSLNIAPKASVLALGGASWPRVGSGDSWKTVLTQSKLKMTPFQASNAGLTIGWSDFFKSKFHGSTLKSIMVSRGGQQAKGDVTITRYGLESGPIYPLSNLDAPQLFIDFKPDLSDTALRLKIQNLKPRASLAKKAQQLKLPPCFPALAKELSLETSTPEALAETVKKTPIPIADKQPIERSISTSGGLCLSNLEDNSFKLRQCQNTWAIGEMLDWDAPTGGYLLQACFSQAVMAANEVKAVLDH